ncbi:hypothetical protein K32_49130 [Kaistia sp. 32K]|nr:hypothetical protein K32_49130 [Kaistia sp. 32K]
MGFPVLRGGWCPALVAQGKDFPDTATGIRAGSGLRSQLCLPTGVATNQTTSRAWRKDLAV